jgi:hypothetical protein
MAAEGTGGLVWLLSKLADEMKMIVIAPSDGAGRWAPADADRRVRMALAAAQRIVNIDATRRHMIGLSNAVAA